MSTLAERLREAADFAERIAAEHPELPEPHYGVTHELSWAVYSESDPAAAMAQVAKAVGGHWEKKADEQYYRLARREGDLRLLVWAFRNQVCERVSKGTREVEKQVPTAFETVTETVEDFEWECSPLLAKAAQS